MAQAKARGPYAKTAAKRAEIVRAARDSFVEHGYAAASLRDIAERVGTTHAGILHHFRSKEELLTEVLKQRDAEEWEHALVRVDGPDAFGPYLAELLASHQRAPELMRLWLELGAAASRPDHPAHEYFSERYQRVRGRLTAGMRDRADQGTLNERLDPETTATLFLAMLNGLQFLWLLDPSVDIIQPFVRFVDLIAAPQDT